MQKKKEPVYRKYSPASMDQAYKLWQSGVSVYKAAKLTGVPKQTLRDRTCGRVEATKHSSGPDPIFSLEEEQDLTNHVISMAQFGYGYTRFDLRNIATDLAIYLKKKCDDGKLLSEHWLYGYLSRNPTLKVSKPKSLSMVRARSATKETIDDYFNELGHILDKYHLKNAPHRIFNVDETGFSPEHKPPSVLGPRDRTVSAITTPRSNNTTMIAACSAAGQIIPPFFVFAGKRFTPDLMKGALPGSAHCMSEKGWSNSLIFQEYLTSHLVKFIPQGDGFTLILYDGVKSHISAPLVKWARKKNIILMVLPAHTSHILQPLDVGCFGSMKNTYYSLCRDFMKNHIGQIITRYDICSLSCKAYAKSVTVASAVSAFRNSGIYPYNPTIISSEKLAPSIVTNPSSSNEISQHPSATTVTATYLRTKVPAFTPPYKKQNRARNMVGGKAITEDSVANTILNKTSTNVSKRKISPEKRNAKKTKSKAPSEAVPSTSGVHITNPVNSQSLESDVDDNEKCCQCNLWSPKGLKHCVNLTLVNWAQCDRCSH